MKERIAEFLEKMKKKNAGKKTQLDDTLAPEFERVETADLEQGEEEKQDGQEKNETKAPIKTRVRNLIER